MLVMHAGPHKTASTYIQNNFAAARKPLARAGWIYPEFGTEGLKGHHHLAHNARLYVGADGPHGEELRALGRRAAAEEKNLLFSAEGFCRWGVAKFLNFARVMEAETLDIVYVVREPFSLLYSYWAEEVKQGRTSGFADRFLGSFASPFDCRLLNPMQDLHPLLAQSRIRLHVVPFDLLMRRKIDIFGHICETVLGEKGVPLTETGRKNTSYSIELTEFLRLLTLIHGKDAPHVGSDFRMHFTRKTTPAQREEMAALIRSEGRHARREISVPGKMAFTDRLDLQLKKRLAGRWTLDPGEEPLFPDTERRLVYYNEYHLWKVDAIRETAIEMERDLAMSMASAP
jgi:hypothetical protein